ncbi:MAG TPA: histidine kinase dimerization/phospho-acceptor domain-containing protein, partial [Candidatus Limiplasma sp.]|nr:histidine kinase dimerization/phospho-acceptor domain-containing protein [Candidatus Limiplasma sp.]
MQKKLFWSLVGFSLAIALFLCVLLTGGMYLYFNNQLRTQLVKDADTLTSLLDTEADPAAFLRGGVYMDRITLVDTDGTVLFDSQSDASKMENHLDRAEIADALQNGVGWASRNSATVGDTSVYYARRLQNGQILRIAGTQKNVLSMLTGMFGWFALGIFVCTLLASILARPITRSLVQPFNRINLDAPLQSDVYEELAPMLRRMDAQNNRIATQMTRMQRQQLQLNAILSGLREGLVVMDESHRLLAINPAARQILGAGDGDLTGKTLPEINRHETLMRLLKDTSGVGELAATGRIFRVSASVAGEGLGLVLLMQDVTEARMAEQNRQQFNANVSHELRTPLTTMRMATDVLYDTRERFSPDLGRSVELLHDQEER